MYNAIDLARYIINYYENNDSGISNLKLQKVLYFLQAEWMVAFNKPLFKDKIEAWDFGPVIPNVYKEFRVYGAGFIPEIKRYWIYEDKEKWWTYKQVEYKDKVLMKDKIYIDEMLNKLKNYPSLELVKITQNQNPWADIYSKYNLNEITPQALYEYFS